jgi:hypothetical protein
MNERWVERLIHMAPASRHADSMDPSGEDEASAVAARVSAFLERTDRSAQAPVSEVEALLADGYACVLALEAGRARIASQSADLFHSPVTIRSAARELRVLNALLLARDREIADLRSLLAELREWAATQAPLAR